MIRGFLRTCAAGFAALVSPPFCAECASFLPENTILCDRCREKIIPLVSTYVDVNDTYTMPVYAFAPYDGIVRSLIIAKHYQQRVASRQLGRLVALSGVCPWHRYDVLVPVPLHWTRGLTRGFNQALVMAHELHDTHAHLQVAPVISRARRTKLQATLSGKDREKNVARAFVARAHARQTLEGKHVLIVDDLMTTGSTLRSIARVILTCKPASVAVVVAARVL